MYNYDFKILSPTEFEWFTRDLLQAEEKLIIESFAEGRDGGIDLRFAYDSSKRCIIQCKKYKDWTSLKSILSREVSKVKMLNPDRYIISTSVDLTAANKDYLKQLFEPYIHNTATDILGNRDLNSFLARHLDVEKQYYKLWLSSSNILEIVLHRNVINWSDFEREKIIKEISRYVQNESFNKALDILKQNHFIIITGVPGIGKTTLARMLVYHFLSKNYEEVIYVVDDLDTACNLFDKNKKQIFFFDDFLGANSFVSQTTSFENKLISFINIVQSSSNTLFVMTTREYILSEAKCYYEKIELNNIEIAKCSLDLADYSTFVRAQILYNHLLEAELPSEYLCSLLQRKSYMSLIRHRNFNPRVIEGLINQQIWKTIPPYNFVQKALEFFENPLLVWEKAFLNLDNNSRYALLVLVTMGKLVYLEEWRYAYHHFCKKTKDELGIYYEDVDWLKSVKILQNCFISIQLFHERRTVEPFNPSIVDYCISYIRNNEHTLILLLSSSLYPEQLTNIFSEVSNHNNGLDQKVALSDRVCEYWQSTCQEVWLRLRNGDKRYLKKRTETDFCNQIFDKFPVFCSKNDFIERKYNFNELCDNSIYSSLRFNLIDKLNWSLVRKDPLEFLLKIVNEEFLDAPEWLDFFKTIKNLDLWDRFEEYSDNILDEMEQELLSVVDSIELPEECDELEVYISDIQQEIPIWNNQRLLEILEEHREQLNLEEEDGDYNDFERFHPLGGDKAFENERIHEMFTSLYENS